MENMEGLKKPFDLSFYKGKNVLITGHTGFKGSWLCQILKDAGANVIGYSLVPPTHPNLFSIAGIDQGIVSINGDIRDYVKLKSVFDSYHPEIVFHLAAQPIVLRSYDEPRYTYETNVMGTVNIMECLRLSSSVRSAINITTDKVYKNNEILDHSFSEDEALDGFDPYSNSKSCSELVTHSYKSSFLDKKMAVSTARAGNVIGGGDFAENRIIPDAVRAIENNKEILVRNPNSIRPYQHVLEPLYVYLMIAEAQYQDSVYSGYYNVGPDKCDCVTTGELMDKFCKAWGSGANWKSIQKDGPHEANFLKLNCQKVKDTFSWKPRLHIDEAIQLICNWTKVYFKGSKQDVIYEMQKEINFFFHL